MAWCPYSWIRRTETLLTFLVKNFFLSFLRLYDRCQLAQPKSSSSFMTFFTQKRPAFRVACSKMCSPEKCSTETQKQNAQKEHKMLLVFTLSHRSISLPCYQMHEIGFENKQIFTMLGDCKTRRIEHKTCKISPFGYKMSCLLRSAEFSARTDWDY